MATSTLVYGVASRFGPPETSERCSRSPKIGTTPWRLLVTHLQPRNQYWELFYTAPDSKKPLAKIPLGTFTCSHIDGKVRRSVLAFYNIVYATAIIPNMDLTPSPCAYVAVATSGVEMVSSSWKPLAPYITPIVTQLLSDCKQKNITALSEVRNSFDNVSTTDTTPLKSDDCYVRLDSEKNHYEEDLDIPISVPEHAPNMCQEVTDCELTCECEFDCECDEFEGVLFYCPSDDEDEDCSDDCDDDYDQDTCASDIETDCLSEDGSIVFSVQTETQACSKTATPTAVEVVLSHASSFSSEESGFCEASQSDWSEGEEEGDKIGTCELSNELWGMFQDMGCFKGVRCSSTTKGSNKKIASLPNNDATSHNEDTLLDDDTLLHHPQLANDTPPPHRRSCTVNKQCPEDDSTPTHPNEPPRDQSPLQTTDNNQRVSSKNPGKCVRFKPEAELVQVHLIVAWDFAYRNSRKGPWEELARDRDHFRRRVANLSEVLEPCLQRKVDSYNHK